SSVAIELPRDGDVGPRIPDRGPETTEGVAAGELPDGGLASDLPHAVRLDSLAGDRTGRGAELGGHAELARDGCATRGGVDDKRELERRGFDVGRLIAERHRH